MKTLTAEPVSINYCIELSLSQFRLLEAKNDEYNDNPENKDVLIGVWEKEFDIERLDWNGHFGANIFFTGTEKSAAKFVKYLNKYLSK